MSVRVIVGYRGIKNWVFLDETSEGSNGATSTVRPWTESKTKHLFPNTSILSWLSSSERGSGLSAVIVDVAAIIAEFMRPIKYWLGTTPGLLLPSISGDSHLS